MKPTALLLIGPSGCGKSPFGDSLAKDGLTKGLSAFFGGVTACIHFDFGSELRKIAASTATPEGFSSAEADFIRNVLKEGLLLEDDSFPLAEKILSLYIRNSGGAVIAMNGLPRHTGQAAALEKLLDVRGVVHFVCDSAIAAKRIENNTGGDRVSRPDDTPDAVAKRHSIYEERTSKLICHYQRAGVPVIEKQVFG